MFKQTLLGLLCLALIFQLATSTRRPIWSLGHMVNAIKQVDSFLNDGANALESDVSFNKYGVAEYTYHGVPCDCFRDCLRWEYFTTFVEYIRDKSTPGSNSFRPSYVLQFWDLKISSFSQAVKEKAIADVAKKLITHFYNKSPTPQLYFIMSLPHSDDIKLSSILHQVFRSHGLEHLTENIGWDVYSYEELHSIRYKWTDVRSTTTSVWQGDGITNCLPRNAGRLQRALNMRNSGSDSFMSKVYYWTVDRKATMRMVLDMGVDGIMTNHPARLRDVLNEGGVRDRFRLANSMDDPFVTFQSYSTQSMLLNNSIVLVNVEDNEVQEVPEDYDPLPKSENQISDD